MPRDPRVEKLQRLRTERMTRAAGSYYGTRATPYGAVPSGPRYRNAGRTLLSLVLFVVIIAIVLYGLAQYALTGYRPAVAARPHTVIVTVTAGESKSAIADELQRDGVIGNSFVFYWYLRVFGNNIQPGQHTLHTGMTMQEALQALETAPPSNSGLYAQVTVTIQEGWRAEQVAQALAKAGVASYADVMHEVRYGVFSYPFLAGRPKGATLEGYLFPDTYKFYLHRGAHYALTRMLDDFGQQVSAQVQAQGARVYGSFYRAMIMASIVQREAGTPHDRYLIASVYLNRLRDQTGQFTKLDADPTVQYALGHKGDWWPQITQADYQSAKSPFNTYLHPGLPPAPIAEPSLSSIAATVQPAHTNYFWFYHVPGSHGKSIFCTAGQGTQCPGTPQ